MQVNGDRRIFVVLKIFLDYSIQRATLNMIIMQSYVLVVRMYVGVSSDWFTMSRRAPSSCSSTLRLSTYLYTFIIIIIYI